MASYLTREDVQNFGSEMVDLAQRSALHAVAPHLQHLEQQSADLRAQLAQETRRGVDQAFDRAVPNWREVDRDPRWLNWLALPDPYTGRSRQLLLDDAAARGAAAQVIALFNGFLREAGGGSPGRSPPASAQPSGRIYSRAEVAQLLDRRRTQHLSPAERMRLEAEIIAAGREGRIAGALSLDGRKPDTCIHR